MHSLQPFLQPSLPSFKPSLPSFQHSVSFSSHPSLQLEPFLQHPSPFFKPSASLQSSLTSLQPSMASLPFLLQPFHQYSPPSLASLLPSLPSLQHYHSSPVLPAVGSDSDSGVEVREASGHTRERRRRCKAHL